MMNPMMMGGMNPMMGGMGMMSSMFMMMQMMQMMQMMRMMQGQMGMMGMGGMHGGGYPMNYGMGNSMGMHPPMGPSMPFHSGGCCCHGGMSHAPMTDVGRLPANSSMGRGLLNSIRNTPVPPRCCPGYCYRGAKHHLRQVGVNLHGGSAYQAADQLAQTGKFNEVRISREQLKKLPAGAVVVWDRNPAAGKRHGHISIATGDGREASDKIRRQITNYPSSYRVFIPKQ